MAILNFTTTETTSRTRTLTYTLPNLNSVNSVRVDIGSVSVLHIVGNQVTVQVSGGSISNTVQTGGSYTPSDSKTVTDIMSGRGTSWLPILGTPSIPSFPSNISYNSGGYSGVLSSSISESGWYRSGVTTTTENPTTGAVTVHELYLNDYTAHYSGTVTRPASDTRTYAYYYQYTITFDYIDFVAPPVNINGVWREVKEVYTNVNGTWRKVTSIYGNVNGVWKHHMK